MIMEKVYKMNGYDLHLIPTNKFKNITISLKLQNTLDKETVTKRTLLSFMLTTGQKIIRLPKSYQNTWRACMA